MYDGDGCILLIAFTMLILIGSCGGYGSGRKTGRIEGSCNVRAEYAKTSTDTLAVARTYPECRDRLFPDTLADGGTGQ